MNLDHWKPLGGFIENTIRPLIEESKWFLDELEKKGISVTEENIKRVTKYIALQHLRTVCVQAVQNIIIITIIGVVFCKISR